MVCGYGSRRVLPGIQQANVHLYQIEQRGRQSTVLYFSPLKLGERRTGKIQVGRLLFFFFQESSYCREMKEGQRGPLYLIAGFKVIRNTQRHCNSKAMSPIAFVSLSEPQHLSGGLCQHLDCAKDSGLKNSVYGLFLSLYLSS